MARRGRLRDPARASASYGEWIRVPRPMAREAGQLEAAIRHLASISRPSASDGEREAAEWLAGELRTPRGPQARVGEGRAHGTDSWAPGPLSGLAPLARPAPRS